MLKELYFSFRELQFVEISALFQNETFPGVPRTMVICRPKYTLMRGKNETSREIFVQLRNLFFYLSFLSHVVRISIRF